MNTLTETTGGGDGGATDLVTRLREDELQNLRAQLNGGSREVALKNLDERGIAQELIRQQYSGRYPFELLQNADDAAAESTDRTGSVARFIVTGSALIVADMGLGFGDRQIRAICSLGRTSKDRRKTIGYKGLGFKSVEEITDRPQVISGKHRFMFDRVRARQLIGEITGPLDDHQRVPVYAYPLPVDQADLGEDSSLVDELKTGGFQTVIRLPFRVGVTRAEVSRDVRLMLSPRVLLFLQATRQLEVEGTSGDFVAIRGTDNAGLATETSLEVGNTTEHWLVFERRLAVSDPALTAPLGDAWSEVDEVRVAMALPLRANGRPGGDETFPLHVHFPTEEATGLSAIVHGDFVLDLDRRRLALAPEAQPYNAWLSQELAALVGIEVAPYLAERYPMDASVVSALSPRGVATGFGDHVLADYVDALRTSRFLPAIDGKPRMPSEAILRPPLPDPTVSDQFLELVDLGNLVLAAAERDASARSFLSDRLDVRELTPRDLVDRLKRPDVSGARPFYEWLVSWAQKLPPHHLARLLAAAPCVLTTSGTWRPPGSGVFFPRAREDVVLPDDIPVEIADVPEVADLEELLLDAGVRRFRWRELLLEIVLPQLTSSETPEAERTRAHHALRSYFEAESRGDLDILSKVGGVLVLAAKARGGPAELRPARKTYFSSVWLGHERIEAIYGPFGQPEFLAENPPADSDEFTEMFRYLEQLGVAQRPRTDAAEMSAQAKYLNPANHPHRRAYGRWWQRWEASKPFQQAAPCGQNHTASQQLASYALDRFPALVDAGDPTRLRAMFWELAAGWGPTYSGAAKATFHCSAQNHVGERERPFLSLMMFMLRSAAWLPASRAGELVLERPHRTWRVSAAVSRHSIPFLALLEPSLEEAPVAGALCEAVGVIDSARPRARDVASILRAIADVVTSDGDNPARWDDAARWAMRELDSSLAQDRPDPTLDGTPLLASLGGELVFEDRPYVAEDRQLAEAWEDELPIFRGDRDLTRLIARFGLPKLEEVVRTTPIVAGLSDADTRSARYVFAQALPYLSALASEAQTSRADAIRSRLRFLEFQACADLVLSYSVDGIVRERTDTTTFLTWQTVREGNTRRRIGTAYLEVGSSKRPDWYSFGPQLADYLEVPTQRDSFALVLEADQRGRDAFMRSRGLLDRVAEERVELNVPEPPVEEWLPPVGVGTGSNEGDAPDREGTSTENMGGTQSTDTGAQEGTETKPTHQEEVLPPLDVEGIQGVDVSPALVDLAPASHGGSGGGGPAGSINWEHYERMGRTYGRRGEEAAIGFERTRVRNLGFDPDEVVVWESDAHELMNYDIRSVDDKGGIIYIEVKATAAADQDAPFEISAAELSFGMSNRPRYYVYRVVDVRSASPKILRYHDPIGAIEAGHGAIRVTGAKMYLAPKPDEDAT